MSDVKTKVCKVCGEEKPVDEFHSKGNGNYSTKCKVCEYFLNKNITIDNDIEKKKYYIIMDYLLNKRITYINELEVLVNIKLYDICLIMKNILKVGGQIKTKILLQCNQCGEDFDTTPYYYLKNINNFCSKECSNKFKITNPSKQKILGIRECKICGKPFEVKGNVKDQKYCSNKCKSKDKDIQWAYVNCANCNKETHKPKASIRKYNNSFCSLECELEFKHKENWEFRKCETCGEEYECLKSSTQRFCGYECQGAWQSKTLIGENSNRFIQEITLEDRTVDCDWCGKETILTPSRISNEHHFCSHECSRAWLSKYYVNTDENIERQRKLTVNMLESGILNNKITKPQVVINELLNNINIIYINEKGFKYYSVDNYITDYNLIIEVMGTFYHSDPRFYSEINYEDRYKTIIRDKAKHTYFKKYYNIDILYLWEYDINNNIELCKKIILEYINKKGILDNYQSFNYMLKDNILMFNSNNKIKPYIEYEAFELRKIINIKLKEKLSKKQLDKWTIFNCEVCGKEKEQLTSHYIHRNNHYCSNECRIIGSIKSRKNLV